MYLTKLRSRAELQQANEPQTQTPGVTDAHNAPVPRKPSSTQAGSAVVKSQMRRKQQSTGLPPRSWLQGKSGGTSDHDRYQ